VEGNEDLGAPDGCARDVSGLEAESGKLIFLGNAVAEFDQFGPRFDSAEIGVPTGLLKPFAGREGQVALAATHVDQLNCRLRMRIADWESCAPSRCRP